MQEEGRVPIKHNNPMRSWVVDEGDQELVFTLPIFGIVFQVDCDANTTTIRGICSYEGEPTAFFCKILNDVNKNI